MRHACVLTFTASCLLGGRLVGAGFVTSYPVDPLPIGMIHAQSINNAQDVIGAGEIDPATQRRSSVLVRDQELRVVAVPGGAATLIGLDDSGRIVGATPGSSFVISDGKVTPLSRGTATIAARGVSSSGLVVGLAQTSTSQRVVTWVPSGVDDEVEVLFAGRPVDWLGSTVAA